MDLDVRPLTGLEGKHFMTYRHYVVTGNTTSNGRAFHKRFSVVCRDIKRAIDLAEKETGMTVIGVADLGPVEKVEL